MAGRTNYLRAKCICCHIELQFHSEADKNEFKRWFDHVHELFTPHGSHNVNIKALFIRLLTLQLPLLKIKLISTMSGGPLCLQSMSELFIFAPVALYLWGKILTKSPTQR